MKFTVDIQEHKIFLGKEKKEHTQESLNFFLNDNKEPFYRIHLGLLKTADSSEILSEIGILFSMINSLIIKNVYHESKQTVSRSQAEEK